VSAVDDLNILPERIVIDGILESAIREGEQRMGKRRAIDQDGGVVNPIWSLWDLFDCGRDSALR
jgi:hypothetical protein